MRRDIALRVHRRTPVQCTYFIFSPCSDLRHRIRELEELRKLARAAELRPPPKKHNDNTLDVATTAVANCDFGDSIWFGGYSPVAAPLCPGIIKLLFSNSQNAIMSPRCFLKKCPAFFVWFWK